MHKRSVFVSGFLPPAPIHKIFLEYMLLNKIKEINKGISGYKLKKEITDAIKSRFTSEDADTPNFLSQTMVYRLFKDLKERGYLNAEEKKIDGRTQKLYTLNEVGKKHLEKLKIIIQSVAPIDMAPTKTAMEFMAGRIDPLDLIPKHFPKDQLLKMLKQFQKQLLKTTKNLERKIEEIEKELA